MATENNTINTKVTLDATEAQQEIVKLNAVAADGTKDLTERIEAKNKQIKLQEKLNKDEIKSLLQKVKSLEGVEGSEKDLEKAIIKLNKTRVKTLKQETNLIKQSNKLKDSFNSQKGAVNKLDNATGGLITSMSALAANPIVLTITILVGLFKLLKEAFTSSEEGMDSWNKVIGVTQAILGNFLDLIADVAEKLVWMVTEPRQAISDFGKTLKENITNRIEGLITLLPSLGKAVSLVFEGKFSEAGKVAVDAIGKVTTGLDSVTDSVNKAGEALGDFIEEQQREAGIAAEIADKRAAANKLDTELIKQRANANKDRAELLNKAEDKERFNAKQRAEFLRQASKLEEDITNKEIAAGKLRLEAKTLENGLSRSSLEDKQEEARLEAELINLQTAKLTKEKEIITKIIGFNNEAKAAAEKEAAAKKKQEEEAFERRKAEIQGFKDDILERERIQSEADQRAIDKKKADKEAEKVRLAEEAEMDRIARNEIDALEIERLRANGENTSQLEIDLLLKKQEQELAIFTGTLEQKKALEKSYSVAIGKLQMSEVKAAKAKDKAMLDSVVGAAGEAFGINKELALAESAIGLGKSIGDAWAANSKLGFPQNVVATAAQVAGQVPPIIKSIASIKKTRFSGGGGRGGSRGGSGGGSIAIPTGIGSTNIDDLSANNAANVNAESGLNSSASIAASANVAGSASSSIVFQEGQYNDFQDQVNFVEGQTNID